MKREGEYSKMESDEQMIRDDSRWPHWPRLPMKRRSPDGRKEELAVLFPQGAGGLTGHYPLYKINLFEGPKDTDIPCLYPSPASVVEDGWRVD